MANLSSMTRIINGTPGPYGANVTIIEGTFPISSASATCPVGNLSTSDLVEVTPVQAVASHVAFCEVKASRVASIAGQGIVTIKPIDASTTPASTIVLQVRVYRNT
jgi:hypothetical protein